MNEDVSELKGSVLDVRRENYGKRDHEIFSIHAYALGLESLHAIIDLPSFTNVQTLSLHNNNIAHIERLESLTNLTELNLSSNNLQTIEGLTRLFSLEILNLASNGIQKIEGLERLTALRRLVLSHNQIASLDGLSALHGPRYSLTSLDLRDNLVASLSEVWVLAGLPKLTTLVFSAGHQDNPVCHVANYRQAVTTAIPGLQSLDGVQIQPRRISAGLTANEPQETAASRQNVNRPVPGRPIHTQLGYNLNNQLPYWRGGDGTAPPGLPAQSERAASGAFTSTSFTPKIDHALQGFYRRQQQRGGPRQGEQALSHSPHQNNFRPLNNQTRNVFDDALGGQENIQGVVNAGGQEQGESFHTEEHRRAAEYEDRIRVLESRLLDLAQKVEKEGGEKERVAKKVSEGGSGAVDLDGRSVQERSWSLRQKEADFDSADQVAEEERISGWKKRKGGEEVAGGNAPPQHEARPRTLIHGHGGQEGKNKIVNTGTQRLLALVNERKTKKGAMGATETSKLRTVLLADEATQTSNTEDFRVSRLTREADALRKELDSVADELAKRDAADAKAKAVAAQEREERERASKEGAEKRAELEELVKKLTKESAEKQEAWAKKESDLQGTLLEAERRAEAKAHSLEVAQESLAALEAQAVSAKARAVSDAVQTLQKELSDVRTEKARVDADLAAAAASRKELEGELERGRREREGAQERARVAAAGAEEVRKKLQAVSAEAEASKVGEAAARDEARRMAAALALCHEDHQIAINHLKELHSQEVQNLVEREAAHARERAALESGHAQAKRQLEGRIRDLEDELRNALQDNAAEIQRLQGSLERAELEAAENRRSLRASLQKESQAEELVAELTEVVRRQKAKIEALQKEREEAEPRRGEVAALRRRVETLATRELELGELLSEKEGALAATDAALEKRTSENRELGAALAKAQESERRRGDEEGLLRQRLELAEDKVKIKDKMLDSQNASLAGSKGEIARLKTAVRETEDAAARAAAEWKERLRDEIEQGRALRAELEAQDATLAELEDKLEAERGAGKKAAAEAKELRAKLDEKDGVLRFVEQEVDRVKGLFESKKRALVGERDKASDRARVAEGALREALEAAEKEKGALRMELDELRSESVALRKASAASDATLAQVRSHCQQRVSEVEEEMRGLLRVMERQKAKSAVKVQQLSTFVEELQRSS
ncbi:hypothetical protein KFL_000080190 [Klebsormidium nitens]|uniref:Uncharacterized protein n=1 Tax=Klebsormidium nitens TaxID=105231 RepID=A0A1Y1HI20_KLENI|nr:hypothetical protein KFL_000080190 [Klebsormidium nitens]|eukprot:GAQ78115.1 hypothetical protein KFL_000080190 [Klebsormidium nitens]